AYQSSVSKKQFFKISGILFQNLFAAFLPRPPI
ncbi:MAG: hypothetical protein ACI920_003658, partial [Saprospiraceae bacterium]